MNCCLLSINFRFFLAKIILVLFGTELSDENSAFNSRYHLVIEKPHRLWIRISQLINKTFCTTHEFNFIKIGLRNDHFEPTVRFEVF